MKKYLIFSLFILSGPSPLFSKNVNIPDANFLNALIDLGVDANVDGMISYTEAEAVTNLDVSYKSISDLAGIESFINLTTLSCYSNQLTSLDVSNNAALIILYCYGNQLTSLDVSNNAALTQLYCYFNQLSILDVTNNSALTQLYCHSNQLTSLDVSNNAGLTTLVCHANQLTSLDVSNNAGLTTLSCYSNQLTSLDVTKNISLNNLYLSNMPTLYRVCVWEMPFPPISVNLYITGSPNIYFTTECITDIFPLEINKEIIIYPNPSSGIINIDLDYSIDSYIEIYNINGKLIYSKPQTSNHEQIDISAFPKGVYFVKVKQPGVLKVGKVALR